MVGLMLLHGSIPITKSNGEILNSNLWLVWIPLRRSGKKPDDLFVSLDFQPIQNVCEDSGTDTPTGYTPKCEAFDGVA